jgi:selenocysteine-specific elongation factor
VHVIGTAGHVDHGKSTLIKALTGIDPDRLPEEKEREMTIDLGFAWLRLPSGREVGVVDVPGHERFVKNMVAGAVGMDLVMLVVAADESVMPQTREHLEILDLLGVKRGVAVLTKRDLADPDWLELVKNDVAELLKGTCLEEAPVVAVSATTGEGLEELKALLELPVDRAFTMAGFGTVVTGTLVDGALALGQEVELVPSGGRSRIRGLQTHRQRVERAVPGSRVAVNLTGVEHTAVPRGEVVTTPDWLHPTTTADVHLRMVREPPHPAHHGMGTTFHTGTSECLARLRLLDHEELKAGEEGWAQLHLERPLPLVKGDPFIIRSTVGTLGGGTIVDPAPRRHRRFYSPTLQKLAVLAGGSARELLLQALGGREPADVRELAGRASVSLEEAQKELSALVGEGQVLNLTRGEVGPGALVVTQAGWGRLAAQAREALEAHHHEYPLRKGLPKEELRSRLGLPQQVFPHVLALLAAQGALAEEGALARLPSRQVQLSNQQRKTAQEYLRALEAEPFSPPTDLEIDSELLAYLVEQGQAVKVSESVVFAASAYRQMAERVVEHLRARGKSPVAEVRDLFGTSRKYALGLMEHLDQQHITRRIGDERVLAR